MSESINGINPESTLETFRINPLEEVEGPPVAIMVNSEGGPTPSYLISKSTILSDPY